MQENFLKRNQLQVGPYKEANSHRWLITFAYKARDI